MDIVHINHDALENYCASLLVKVGLSEKHASETSSAICLSSLRGTDSHGLRLLPHYIDVIGTGRIVADAKFTFIRTGHSTGLLNANHGMAHAAIAEAMDHALEMAKQTGVAFVSIKNSNHCGAMAPFALRACSKDMIGFAFTNATAKVQTFNARQPFFGINPICMAAPMLDEEPFCFDAAPTVMSNNKVKMYAMEGKSLPNDVAADSNGNMVLDPALAKMLIPLGGQVAGYKGFGWAMMVDILCSILSGMPNGINVSSMYETDGGDLSQKRYLGQLVGAIRIENFIDVQDFKTKLQRTADDIRKQQKHNNAADDIMIPGDPEKLVAHQRRLNGIPVSYSLVNELNVRADRYGFQKLVTEL